MSVKRIQHLFVVRLWAETAATPVSEDWHGLVQHMPTGQKLYFTSLSDLTDFVEAQLAVGTDSPGSSDKEAEVTVSEQRP